MTLGLPDELHESMRRHPHIKWSEVARRAFQQELSRLEIYDQLLAGSTLTEQDAVALGREIRRSAARKTAAGINAGKKTRSSASRKRANTRE